MKRNEKGNLEDDSASHRDCTHCTLYFTRSYELHVVHVEIKLFTKKERKKEMKKETWKTILQVIVTVLTALCTSLGVTSCMQYM